MTIITSVKRNEKLYPKPPKQMLTVEQLTEDQHAFLQATAKERGESIKDYLKDLSPDPFIEKAIQGMLPHCGLWGLMEADGRCHT